MKAKKYIAFILAFCLVFSFGAAGTAFAADNLESVENSEIVAEQPAEAEATPEETAPEEVIIEEVEAQEAAVATDMTAQDQAEAAQYSYVPGQVIVVFGNGASEATAQSVAETASCAVMQSEAMVSGDTMSLVDIPETQTVQQAVEMFNAMPDVKYAQPNFTYQLEETEKVEQTEATDVDDTPAATQAALTNDPLLGEQWYMDKLEVGKAWKLVEDYAAADSITKKVRVAVLDSPIDMNHEDLQAALNKELSVDVSSDVVRPPFDTPGSVNEHGTHVAGLIAATSNNGKGIAGVAAGTKNQIVDLVSISVFDQQGKTTDYSTAVGMNYAIGIGSDVINMSLGERSEYPFPEYGKVLRDLCDAAYTRGIITVVAAGNENTDAPTFPSDFESVISIMASKNWTDPSDYRAPFSNYGPEKDFIMPGVNILSTIPSGEYDMMSGTSMASPIAAGIVALMKYVDPSLDMKQAYLTMKTGGVTPLSPYGYDIYSGWGQINARKSIDNALWTVSSQKKPAIPQNVKAVSTGISSTKLTWTPVKGATGYIIYKTNDDNEFNDNNYFEYKEVTTASFTDTKATVGKKNSYKVAAYVKFNDDIFSGNKTDAVSVTPVCAKPQNLKPKGIDKSSIKVSWDKVAGAKGYYVYASDKKNGTYGYLGKVTGNSITAKGLASGTKYYFKVFAYSIDAAGKNLRGNTAGPAAGQTKS